ncbi:MAG: serine hydrolase domain-containing protein [Imperialibacter sp.]|uniref:serine hydrolase domain-containing protein n=1 Tax=Imperialibacter sp. TaxID=2038411 RepID=UPI003A8B5AAC
MPSKSNNYMRFTSAVICSILFFSACSPKENLTDQLHNVVEKYHNEGFYNGTILIADSTAPLLKEAYGMADFDAKKALDITSTFYMASVSKQFTTMAVMLLKEEGTLTFDDTLSTYFPSFPLWAETVTIRHLLTHTSGIPDYYGLGAAVPGFTNSDVVNVVERIDSLNFAPGEQYEYSNTAYVLLSSIVQQVSGKGFNDFMQENIFKPTGMTSTVAYDETMPERSNPCKGFDADGKEDDYPYFTTGGGGLYSNVEDMYKWHQALQSYKLVSKATMAEAHKPMTLNDGSTSWYGFGWMLDEKNSNRVLHTGTLTSFRTYIERNLENGQVIIMLNNVGKTKRDELLGEIKALMKAGESNH